MKVTLAAAVVTNISTTAIDTTNDMRLRRPGNGAAPVFQLRSFNLSFIEVSPILLFPMRESISFRFLS
jgi:hypothetical protein